MIEIFVFVILVGMFFVDHRLSRLTATQTEALKQLRAIRNAVDAAAAKELR